MFVKRCRKVDEKPDIVVIECSEVRFCPDISEQEKDVRFLQIKPVDRAHEQIDWMLSGDQEAQVYLLNNEGKTIERLW